MWPWVTLMKIALSSRQRLAVTVRFCSFSFRTHASELLVSSAGSVSGPCVPLHGASAVHRRRFRAVGLAPTGLLRHQVRPIRDRWAFGGKRLLRRSNSAPLAMQMASRAGAMSHCLAMRNVQLARRPLSPSQDDAAVGEQLLQLARHGWSPPTSSDLSCLWGRLPDQCKGAPLHVRFLLLRLAMVLGASASAGMEVGPPIELAIDMDDCLQSSFDELQRSLPCGRPVRLLSATGPW